MSSTKPSELRIGTPAGYDGTYETAIEWLNSVRIYLAVNVAVYDSDAKKVAFALSYMTKGSALTWANTFCQKAISDTGVDLGKFDTFTTDFNAAFKHQDTTGNTIHWLANTRMTKKGNSYSPSLTMYIAEFKNRTAVAQIKDENVLISYFAHGIPEILTTKLFTTDPALKTIADWQSKAVTYQTAWERTQIFFKDRRTTYHSFNNSFSSSSSSSHVPKPRDPNAMDVDSIRISKLTPEKRKRCIKEGLCFRCRKKGHSSTGCPNFTSNTKPRVQRVQKESDLPKLQEMESDDDDGERVAHVKFVWQKGF